jgi:hypothetical protein
VSARVPRLALAVLAPLALAVPAPLAAGCGGPDPDETVRRYFEAIVDRNGERACAELSEALRRDIERSIAARRLGRTCADIMNLAAGLNPGIRKQEVDDLEIEVEEDGDRAVARLENPLVRRRETIELVRHGGDWQISSLETRPQG